MKIALNKIEKITGYKVKKDYCSIGFDWATRAGISIIKTNKTSAQIEYIFIEFKTNERKEKYRIMVKTLEKLLNSENIAIIENVFVGFSKRGSLELAKYHAFAISEAIKKNIPFETISAKDCRARLGIKTTAKAGYGKGQAKKAVADYLKNNFKLDLKGDSDACDAVILALLGILEGVKFD